MNHLKYTDALNDQIASGNFIDITLDGDHPILNSDTLGPADFPFLLLEPASEEVNLKATSTSATIEQSYVLTLATAELEASNTRDSGDRFYPIKFEVLRALFPLIGGSTFNSDFHDFSLRHLNVTSVIDSYSGGLFETGMLSWVCEITIVATMTLPRATIMKEGY